MLAQQQRQQKANTSVELVMSGKPWVGDLQKFLSRSHWSFLYSYYCGAEHLGRCSVMLSHGYGCCACCCLLVACYCLLHFGGTPLVQVLSSVYHESPISVEPDIHKYMSTMLHSCIFSMAGRLVAASSRCCGGSGNGGGGGGAGGSLGFRWC